MNLAEGSFVAEHYQLIKQLGHGSFGDVWLAHNVLADIDVAIKFYGALDMKGLEDFRNEFKVAYRLRHPNLLNINHFDIYENCPYLVMPYCAQGSVSHLIGRMHETEIWKFILDVSGGLAFLHSQQPPIVHQDIKPDNILITSDGRYVISDFGISRSFRTKLSRTNNNSSSGTIAYMGPERFSEKPMIVLASDIWAFGMTLYEILTGDVLWEGMGGCVQLNGARIPVLEGRYSNELKNLVMSCLAAETWNRPTAVQINEYATAYLQHKTMPMLPLQKEVQQPIRQEQQPSIKTEDPVARQQAVAFAKSNLRPIAKPNYQSTVSAHKRHIENKHKYQSEYRSVQQSSSNNRKRLAIAAAAALATILLISVIYFYVSHINEEQDFISCKTQQDYEQFIKKHPSSSYVEEAKRHVESMSPAAQETSSPIPPHIVPAKTTEKSVTTIEEHPVIITENTTEQLQPTQPEVKEEVVAKPAKVDKAKEEANADDRDFYQCSSAEDFHNYLKRHPNGKHRSEAADILSGLVTPVTTEATYTNSGSSSGSSAEGLIMKGDNDPAVTRSTNNYSSVLRTMDRAVSGHGGMSSRGQRDNRQGGGRGSIQGRSRGGFQGGNVNPHRNR